MSRFTLYGIVAGNHYLHIGGETEADAVRNAQRNWFDTPPAVTGIKSFTLRDWHDPAQRDIQPHLCRKIGV